VIGANALSSPALPTAAGIAASVALMRSWTRWSRPFRAASWARLSACSNANASAEPWL
jgi:hypothetical protein